MNLPVRVGIVDDHQIVLDGLIALLQDHPGIELVFTETNPFSVLSLLEKEPVAVLITDIVMPGLSGNALAAAVREKYPEVRILALSMNNDGDLVHEMINQLDIAGYALKNIGKEELAGAIEKIARGGIYFSPEVIAELDRVDSRMQKNEAVQLTARETEIIRLIEKEYNNRAIAELLFISERTVETHRKNIFRKTNTNSVLGLIKYAYQQKLI